MLRRIWPSARHDFPKLFALTALAIVAASQPALAGPVRRMTTQDYIQSISRKSGLPVEAVRKHMVDSLMRSKKFSANQIDILVNHDAGAKKLVQALKEAVESDKGFRAAVGLCSIRDRQLQEKLGDVKTPKLVRDTVPEFGKAWGDLSRFKNWKKAADFNEVEGSLAVLSNSAQLIARLWNNNGYYATGEILIVPVRMSRSELQDLKSVVTAIAKEVNVDRPGKYPVEFTWGPFSAPEGFASATAAIEINPTHVTHIVFFKKLVETLTSKREYGQALKRLKNR